MKARYALLLAVAPLVAPAQVIQPSGPGNVPLNWRPAAAIDSLLVDVNGDAIPDIKFTRSSFPSGGMGQPSLSYFNAYVGRASGMEIAMDAAEFDSPHRFVVGDLIGTGLQWQGAGGGYLDYTVVGNGGTGGRGFFRNNASGFVVIRRNLGSQVRYWWFYIEPRTTAVGNWVGYYGGTSVALSAAAPSPAPTIQAFPNPATASWQLSAPAAYELYDQQGRHVGSSLSKPANGVDAGTLAPGAYWLVVPGSTGPATRRRLVKE